MEIPSNEFIGLESLMIDDLKIKHDQFIDLLHVKNEDGPTDNQDKGDSNL